MPTMSTVEDAIVWSGAFTHRLSENIQSGPRRLVGAAKESEASEFAERAVRHFRACVDRDFEVAEHAGESDGDVDESGDDPDPGPVDDDPVPLEGEAAAEPEGDDDPDPADDEPAAGTLAGDTAWGDTVDDNEAELVGAGIAAPTLAGQ